MASAIYLPTLKWMQAEKDTLLNLAGSVKANLLPLLELRKSERVPNFLTEWQRYWQRPALFDCATVEGELTEVREAALLHVMQNIGPHTALLGPVVNPERIKHLPAPLLALLRAHQGPMAVRLRIKAMLTSQQEEAAFSACAGLNRVPAVMTLVVDMCETPQLTDTEQKALVAALQRLQQQGWQQVYLLSGAYPIDSRQMRVGRNEVMRTDWQLWQTFVQTQGLTNVHYGDYGIVSPKWDEEDAIRRGKINYRYATSKHWIVYRSDADGGTAGNELAQLLTLESDFRGAAFSWGDDRIAQRADNTSGKFKLGCGNKTQHIAEGMNHHLTQVVDQLLPTSGSTGSGAPAL
ncbi:hypothetical protein HPT27_11490 [Permianibacter sp. IMCC34836]|uniref:beta family protein n=1 Tax=Permianibacter fluminis TaxID=2738515 RepID=UPI0015551737|nr:hypothetical protein [Permianibacter fluminis]NQD37649.1 hypothetical protein [Permianibacter fluminis]